MRKFLILSLGRSRSKWLSAYLSYGGAVCGHDLAVGCSSIADFVEELDGVDGSCETGAVLGWRVIRERFPEIALVTIHRPITEIYNSFLQKGFAVSIEDLLLRSGMLEALSTQPGVLSLSYAQLATPQAGAQLFEHCLDLPFDSEWWGELAAKNIQINLMERFRAIAANAKGLDALKEEIFQANERIGGAGWHGLN